MDVVTYALAKGASKKYTDAVIAALPKGMVYKGSVPTYEDLPSATASVGDVYTVVADSNEYCWTQNSEWILIGAQTGVGKYSTDITGDGTTTEFTITHGLGLKDVPVVVFNKTSGEDVLVNITRLGDNSLKLVFATAPTASEVYTVTCMTCRGPKGDTGESGGVSDVQVNGTSILSETVANIPLAATDTLGVVKAKAKTSTETVEVAVDSTGKLYVAEGGLVDDVQIDGTSIVTDKIATIPAASSSTAGVSKVIDNVTSTGTTDALSANMGKELQDRITNMENIGTFLSIWNCTTGLPTTNPTVMPYTMKVGSYYRIGVVAGVYTHTLSLSGNTTDKGTYEGTYDISFALESETASSQLTTVEAILSAMGDETRYTATGTVVAEGVTYTVASVLKWVQDSTSYLALCDANESKIALVLESTTQTDTVTGGTVNYRPDGEVYTGAASTVVETEDVEVGGVYYWDGTTWCLQKSGSGGLVQDVQINGTTILDLDSGVANIPVATASVYGVIQADEYTTAEIDTLWESI